VTPGPSLTLDVVLDRASAAYDGLAGVAEEVEDEWSYIQDLTAVWRDRLAEVRAGRGGEPVEPPVAAAVDAAIAEIARIVDPHRAIDWLSTFPQVTLVALGERP
jgi:hypothetical protein